MLPAGHRLRRGADITAAVRRGRRATNPGPPLLVAHLRVPDSLEEYADQPARVGFVVSGAVGGAVVRNRVKRRLRHLARARLERLPAGSDLVVRALPAAAGTSYAALGLALDGAIERALRADRRRTPGRRAAEPAGGHHR